MMKLPSLFVVMLVLALPACEESTRRGPGDAGPDVGPLTEAGPRSDGAADAVTADAADTDAPGTADAGGPDAAPLAPSVTGSFTLSWHDEFDGNDLDGSKWRLGSMYLFFPGAAGISEKNLWVDNGYLWMKAEKRSVTYGDSTRSYAAAEVSTFDTFRQKYGLFEARIKVDAVTGLWPAFWTMPDNGKRGTAEDYRRSLLRFDLSSIPAGSITSAVLKLRVKSFDAVPSGQQNNITVLRVPDDSWTESGVTWNNQPAPAAIWIKQEASPALTVGQDYQVDVTAYIQQQRAGDKLASLMLEDGYFKTLGITFHSREASSAADRPRLVVNGSTTLEPVADAYVRGGQHAGSNFGSAAELTLRDGWGDAQSTYGDGMEIDIMESLGIWGPDMTQHAWHWDGYGSDHKSGHIAKFQIPATSDGFHTYALYWEAGKLTFFVDGKQTGTHQDSEVCAVESYILLSLQMGGWDGNSNIDDAKLPAQMQVDWVRVWTGSLP